ncbi:MAG: class I SAM-dependent methyltransferase [Elusimicrobiales bacterium]
MKEKYTLAVGKSDETRLAVMNDSCNGSSLAFLAESGALKPGTRFLELGCGMGQMAALIAKQILPGGKIDAVDSSDRQLELARKYLKKNSVRNANLINASADTLAPEFERKYDVVYSRFLFEHLRNLPQSLKLLKKCLKPGGRLISETSDMTTIFCTPHSDVFDVWLNCQAPPVLKFNTKCGYDIHLRHYEAGFKDVTVKFHQPALHSQFQKSYLRVVFDQYCPQLTGKGKPFANDDETRKFGKKLDQLIGDKHFVATFPRITQICARQ